MRKIEETRLEEARGKRGGIKSDGNVINLSIRTIPKHNILSGFKARVVGAEDFKVLFFLSFLFFLFLLFFLIVFIFLLIFISSYLFLFTYYFFYFN